MAERYRHGDVVIFSMKEDLIDFSPSAHDQYKKCQILESEASETYYFVQPFVLIIQCKM